MSETRNESEGRAGVLEAEPETLEGVRSGAPLEQPEHLLSEQEARRLRRRWAEIQGEFVDRPRESVAEADALVREVVDELRELFESERAGLEASWSRGEEVSTETLRRALQRYRAFFARLLEI